MYFKNTAIGWNPGGDVSVVGYWGALDERAWSAWRSKYLMHTSPVYRSDLAGISGESAQLAALVHFHMLVVRDKVDPMKVHEAFMDIEEYRDAIAPDALPKDVPRWVTPSRKRMPVNRLHGVSSKRTTADLLAYGMDKAQKAERAAKAAEASRR